MGYPIKIGIMALYKPSGEYNEHGDALYEVFAFVPVGCYLIKESASYNENGNCDMEYDVVFMRDNIYFQFLKENKDDNYPKKSKRGISNSIKLNEIYEDFELASKICLYKNEELFYTSQNISWEDYETEINKLIEFSYSIFEKNSPVIKK